MLCCCSNWLSSCKVIYYNIFSRMYGIVGSCAHLAMVNSSWTQSHIEKLWSIPERTKRVYPPCDTSGLQVCYQCLDILLGNMVLPVMNVTMMCCKYAIWICLLTSFCPNRCFLWRGQRNRQKLYLLHSFGQRRWAYKPYEHKVLRFLRLIFGALTCCGCWQVLMNFGY